MAEDSVDDAGTAADVGPPTSGSKKALVITAVVAAVFIVGAVLSANVGQSNRTYGDTIVREYAQGDACTSAQLQLALPEGNDFEPAAEKVFIALEGGQIIKASLDTKSQVLDVAFCDSSTSEDAIRAVLQPLGVLSQ